MIYKSRVRKGMRLFEVSETMQEGEYKYLISRGKDVTKKAIVSKSSQYLYSLNQYINKEVAGRCAQTAMGKYLQIAGQDKAEKIEPTFAQLGMLYWVSMYYLDLGVCYVFNVDTLEGALYTRSYSVLKNELGVALDDKKRDEIEKKLSGTSTFKGFEEKSLFAYRLDAEKAGSKYRFKAVAPRSRLKLNDVVVLPITLMYGIGDAFNEMLKGRVAKFEKTSEIGKVRHIITSDADIVRKNYQDYGNDTQIENKLRMSDEPGFDVVQCRYMGYDLEAPLTSNKMATFKYEKLDLFTQANKNEIDKSLLGVDIDIIRKSYISSVRGFTSKQLEKVRFIDISSFATVKDAVKRLEEFGYETHSEDLYRIMKSNPEIFGDLDKKISNMQRAKPKFLREFEEVTTRVLGSTESRDSMTEEELEQVKKRIYSLSKKGILKIRARAKAGYAYEVTGTMNQEVLDKCYGGRDKWMRFEAPATRLKYAQSLIATGIDAGEVISKLDISSYIDMPLGNTEDVIKSIDRGIDELKEKEKNKSNSGSVVVRSIEAENANKFIRSITIDTIERIAYTEYNINKK